MLDYFNEEAHRTRDETIAKLESEYGMKEKQIENELLKAEAMAAMADLKNSRVTFWGLISLCALLIFAVIMTVKWLTSVRVNRDQLRKFNNELEDRVKEKTALVMARNKRLDETSFKLAHEIRAHVATLMGARNLIEMDGTIKMVDPEIFEAFDVSSHKLDQTVREMIDLLDRDLAEQKKRDRDILSED